MAESIGNRVALYIDLENLVHDQRSAGDFAGAYALVAELVQDAERRGVVVAKVACGDATLARQMAFELGHWGVRTYTHHGGGPDVADRRLLDAIRNDLPDSVDVVVIASGDHIFADVAADLRSRGKHVVVTAPRGSLSWQLVPSADEVLAIPPSPVTAAA